MAIDENGGSRFGVGATSPLLGGNVPTATLMTSSLCCLAIYLPGPDRFMLGRAACAWGGETNE
jgi:hypothetical protein